MSLLERYYETLDAHEIEGALALFAPDVRVAFDVPDGRRLATSRDDMAAYFERVGPIPMQHDLLAVSGADGVEFGAGRITHGDAEIGTFTAVMWLTPDRQQITRYHMQFVPDEG